MEDDIKYLDFEKDPDGRWYVILEEWEGERDELEMVMGADSMLEILSQGETPVSLCITRKPHKGFEFKLSFTGEESGGGNYELDSELFNFSVWLCHVTKFVYGELPKILYISKVG